MTPSTDVTPVVQNTNLAFIPPEFYIPIAVLVWVLFLWLVKRFIIYRLEKWAKTTTVRWDDVVIRSISLPANFLILALGLALLIHLLPVPEKIDKIMLTLWKGSIVVAIVWFLDNLIKGLVEEFSSKTAFNQVSGGITKGLLRGFVIGIGILIFLQLLGISITPILASLGIGSLAVALALQDTLSNFFAGIYVTVDKPVHVGDFIRLESGEEGHVIDIGWRSTRIRTLPNNIVVVPNSKLVSSIITNYYLFDKELAVPIDVDVHYNSDLNHVEKVALEVARETLKKVTGAVPEFEPAFRYTAFKDNGINFTVVLRAKEFTDQYTVRHEFIKRLHERFRREGIIIPSSIRTVEISKETASQLKGFFS